MKKKFTRVALFAAMTFAIGASFVGCKDYDDDIDALNDKVTGIEKSISDIESAMQSGKYITGYVSTENGYELSLSDGTKLTIKHGTNGTNGIDGKTFIPKFRVSAESCWQVSTDDGATWVDVLNEAGEKVVAVGGSNVTINKDGFIVIGDVVTTLKTNTTVPSIVVNEQDGLYIFNINGKEYKVLAEGSAYNGLQSVTYRRKAANDIIDFVESLRLFTYDKSGKDVELMQSTATATFKIWPKTLDLAKATYDFTDTYKTRAAKEPALTYVAGSAQWVDKKDGILSVTIEPNNIEKYQNYASSLDITINGHTTASDYFNFRAADLNAGTLNFVHTNDSTIVPCEYLVENLNNSWSSEPKYTFIYDKSYSLSDSVALGRDWGESFTSMADLGFQGVKVAFKQTAGKEKGIFEIKDNVVTVKAENQVSAINEVCFVTATYTTPDDKVIRTFDFAVKAVREQIPVETNDIAVKVLDSKVDLSKLVYSTTEQKIKLDVRHFENEIGGRDYMANNNWPADRYYSLFYYSTKEIDKKEHKYINKVPAYLHFHSGENTDKDYLELVIPAETIINPAQELFAMQVSGNVGGYWPYAADVVDYTDIQNFEQDLAAYYRISNAEYEVNGKRVKYTVKLNDKVKVSRDVIIKQNTAFIVDGKTTVVGEWDETAQSFTMVGNLEDLYAAYKSDGKTKSDEDVTYVLAPKAKQSAAVQKVYAQITIVNNKLYVDPKVDIATLGSINISANIKGTDIAAVMQDKDGNVVEYATPVLRSPINAWTATSPVTWAISGVATTYDVAKNAKACINDRDINVVDSKGKIVGNALVKDGAIQPWATAYAGVVSYKIKGYSETVNEGTFTIDAATGVLTCNNINIASALEITVTVTLTHNWGTVTKDIVVKAALNN